MSPSEVFTVAVTSPETDGVAGGFSLSLEAGTWSSG